MVRAYIGLGANQGDPPAVLREALQMLDGTEGVNVARVSSLYLTEPVGYEDQPWFHNCVAGIDTALSPEQLLTALQQIENNLGRVRTIRWGPRTIDLDLLLYGTLEMETESLSIPHPRMKERAFVMVPLAEIAPDTLFPDGLKIEEVRRSMACEKKFSCIPQKIW